jgi:hypothetical protein
MRKSHVAQGLALVVSVTFAGCEPARPPPAGYVEACYGGDFRKNIEGTAPKRYIVVSATESDWPRLARDLTAAGRVLGLEVFDTSVTEEDIHTIEIHLCSKNGIWISADQRKWQGTYAESGNRFRNFSEVEITVNPYGKNFDWMPVSDELARTLGRSWQVNVQAHSPRTARTTP